MIGQETHPEFKRLYRSKSTQPILDVIEAVPNAFYEIARDMQSYKYINVIKTIRRETGCGLKEGKDMMDSLKPFHSAELFEVADEFMKDHPEYLL